MPSLAAFLDLCGDDVRLHQVIEAEQRPPVGKTHRLPGSRVDDRHHAIWAGFGPVPSKSTEANSRRQA